MDNRFELVNSVVEEALDLPSLERGHFVAARCGPDQGLRASVQRLLAFSSKMDDFLEKAPASGLGPGDVLGGRFRIVEELGAGGIGTVFLVEDERLGAVALKILHPDLWDDTRAMEQFAREVRNVRAIRHPNICQVFDLFVLDLPSGGTVAAATMQYVSGETLASRLSRGAIPSSEAIQIAKGLAEGIDTLHEAGIVHRDLKPDNVMLTAGRGGAVPIIIDFGLAAEVETGKPECGRTTGRAAIAGSPDYMAPEQFRNASPTQAADIYSFGLILFEMIAGKRPFPAEDLLPAAIRRTTEDAPSVFTVAPCAAHAWGRPIARALLRDPARRPDSAVEMIDDIRRELRTPEARTVRIDGQCCHRWSRALNRRARR